MMENIAGFFVARCANDKEGGSGDVIYVHRGLLRRLTYTRGVLPQEKESLYGIEWEKEQISISPDSPP